jgi:hypothetical protein
MSDLHSQLSLTKERNERLIYLISRPSPVSRYRHIEDSSISLSSLLSHRRCGDEAFPISAAFGIASQRYSS